jgi:hypothetical protein
MRLTDRDAIRSVLKAHGDFGECLLRELRLVDFGLSLEVIFDCVAGPKEQSGTVTLVLCVLHELHLIGAIPPGLLEDPSRVNWGLSEIALVQLAESDSDPRRHRLNILWESDRRIEAAFSVLEVR